MFDQTFVNIAGQRRQPYLLALSSFVQVCVLGILILIPLFYTQVLPGVQLRSVLAAPAPPPAPTVNADLGLLLGPYDIPAEVLASLSRGKKCKKGLVCPTTLRPIMIWAVPVLAQILMPGTKALLPVPSASSTSASIASRMRSRVRRLTFSSS